MWPHLLTVRLAVEATITIGTDDPALVAHLEPWTIPPRLPDTGLPDFGLPDVGVPDFGLPDFGLLTAPPRPAHRGAPRPLPSLHHGPRVVARSTEVAALRDGLLRMLSSVAADAAGASAEPGVVRLRAFPLRRDGGAELAPPGCGDGTSYRALVARGRQPVYQSVVAVRAAEGTVVLDPPWGSGAAPEHLPLLGWWIDAAAPPPEASLALRVAHAAHAMAPGWFDDGMPASIEAIGPGGPYAPLAALVTLHTHQPPHYGRPFG